MPVMPWPSPGWLPREERLPPAGRDDVGHELRQLRDYREQLVKERTRMANRLHAELAIRYPGYRTP
jgi:hypothetical protein